LVIVYNKEQKESFIKSFLLFFISIELLISIIIFFNYQKDITHLDNNIFQEMKICSFDLKCTKYDIKFRESKKQELYKLYKQKDMLYSYFTIPKSKDHYLKIIYLKKDYDNKINSLKNKQLINIVITTIIVFLLSIIFALYSLRPIINALNLTNDFIKDILHDINTPLSSIVLNSKMLKKTKENYSKLNRIEQSLITILHLQDNFKAHLENSVLQIEDINLNELISQRINNLRLLYTNINFILPTNTIIVKSNKQSLIRILDNILINACKYNKENGSVEINIKQNILIIKDTGIGIKDTSKIFKRYYKEGQRGLGLGLNIVQKLSKELNIKINVKSKLGVGSEFTLELPISQNNQSFKTTLTQRTRSGTVLSS